MASAEEKVYPSTIQSIESAAEIGDGCLGCIPALRDNNERQGFVRKVYALLFIQLGITTLFVVAGVISETYRDFVKDHQWVYIVAIAIALAICLMLMCFYKWFKAVPYNYILLFVFVIAESYSVSVVTCYYTPSSVLICASITLAMSFALSVYACFTKNDFTKWYSGLIWALIGALVASIFFTIFYTSRIILIAIAFGVVVIVSICLVADTQLIMGGGKYSLTYDDYVLAVILLYTDIITIFLYILSLFGERSD
eukprot:TRINITY_DN9214_c0_g1_i8.p1 TRINITY_DN9214_c0_g1~~TRINITY_DN9214_c0_g1_i8.p1  ORF type:complete len:254 (-),score=25.90 TRINITY_DN9214_c0_g1_i8:223-984(-)